MVVFWLVLVVTGFATGNFTNDYTPVIMHVGNFSSYTDCQKIWSKLYNSCTGPTWSTPDYYAVHSGQ
jgi:hypothetical protein